MIKFFRKFQLIYLVRLKEILSIKLTENDDLRAKIQRNEVASTEIEGLMQEMMNKDQKI